MKTITHSPCCVIPQFMLSRIGHSNDTGGDDARASLEQMRELANQRALTLIHVAEPDRPDSGLHRTIYDAQGGRALPGKLVLDERDSSGGDVEAREAFDAIGTTWEFFLRVFGRRSIDARGLPLDATVHYGTRFQNAMWNGTQIVYGDPDHRYFNRFTASLDITVHEASHGVVQFNHGMGYSGETGAVNESYADIFGTLAKQWMLEQTVDEADWLIGAELLKPGIHGRGIRSLAEPGTAYDDPLLGRDPQPSHVRDYVDTEEDNGGVHINSGIPNHAFYLAAMEIGGAAWEVAGRIWYETLVQGLPDDPRFLDLALGTVEMAGELYTRGGRYQRIVAEAWAKVGIVLPYDQLMSEPQRRPFDAIPPAMLRRLLPR